MQHTLLWKHLALRKFFCFFQKIYNKGIWLLSWEEIYNMKHYLQPCGIASQEKLIHVLRGNLLLKETGITLFITIMPLWGAQRTFSTFSTFFFFLPQQCRFFFNYMSFHNGHIIFLPIVHTFFRAVLTERSVAALHPELMWVPRIVCYHLYYNSACKCHSASDSWYVLNIVPPLNILVFRERIILCRNKSRITESLVWKRFGHQVQPLTQHSQVHN